MVAGIIGATGYAGAELVRLLSRHPNIKNLILSSVSFEGEKIEDVYPNFLGVVSASLFKPEDVVQKADIVFSALPHGVGEPFAETCIRRGVSFIDLSADFRFDDDEATFSAWYGKDYAHPQLREHSVYGLPELNRRRIKDLAAKGPVIIANPGCYPTGASLGIYPAIAKKLCVSEENTSAGTIIINSVSGTTGGGRELARSFHYPECADSMAPYKVSAHRHTPEIARNIFAMADGEAPDIIFTPHLAPMNRGILSTIYIPLDSKWQQKKSEGAAHIRPPSKIHDEKTAEFQKIYAGFYKGEAFVRVLPPGVIASTNRVRQSNFCDISVHLSNNGTTLIVVSAIDNMVKGAAGQAVQNMNIILGYDEKAGLEAIPALF